MRYMIFIWIFLVSVFFGCAQEHADNLAESTETSTLTENSSTIESKIDLASNANNDFSFDIYNYIERDGENYFLSSYSLYSMLNMLLIGAEGETKDEMLAAANITVSEEEWLEDFYALNASIIKFLDSNNSGFKFSFANSFWMQEGLDIAQEYVQDLQQTFGVNIQTVDFENESQAAIDTINDWTSQMTNAYIPEIVDETSVNENTKIILANAMYLKALWSNAFSPLNTQDDTFTLQDESTIDVPMMHQTNSFRYVEKDGVEVVCMHYQESEFGLVSFLPEAGRFDEFEASLSNEVLDYFASGFEWKTLSLYYPKFEIQTNTIDLKEMLIEKGMESAFDGSADFSGIDASMSLQLSQIVQKVYFKIDEEGTEASSSTAIAIGETSYQESQTVKFDRPFIVMICHIPTRTVLFMGRVLNPLQ